MYYIPTEGTERWAGPTPALSSKTLHLCAHVGTDVCAQQGRPAASQPVHLNTENKAVRVEREQGEWAQFCSNGRDTTGKRQS